MKMAIYSCLIDSRLVRDISKDEAAIMVKLYRHTKFGANHMLEENVLGGMRSRLDASRAALERLKSDGILNGHPTKHGPAVAIPPSLGKEVYEQLKKHYPWLPKPPWKD